MYYFFLIFGQLLLRRAPMLIFVLVACIFAVMRWKRHPRASLLAVLALLIHLVASIAFAIAFRYMPLRLIDLGRTDLGFNLAESALSMFEALVFAGVILLLVAAVFTGRRDQLEIKAP